MTDNRTNEPTPEQILVDEWIRQADRAKSMTGMDAIWFPDAEETLAVLRANGLLSEGAPSEKQARAIRKLDNVQAILAGAQASVTDAVRELSLTSAALEAAGVAPQPITDEQIEAVARSLHETSNPWFVAHGSWEAAGFEIKQAFRASARTALHHMTNI